MAAVLSSVVLALALDAFVGFARFADRRVGRTYALLHALHALEQIEVDLERAVSEGQGPRVFEEQDGLVLTTRSMHGTQLTTWQVWYRFRQDTGELERSQEFGFFRRVGSHRFGRVRFSHRVIAAAPGRPASIVSCSIEPVADPLSDPRRGVTTRPLALWAARAVEPALSGVAPAGWVEPD